MRTILSLTEGAIIRLVNGLQDWRQSRSSRTARSGTDGVLIGQSMTNGIEPPEDVRLSGSDRSRHLYILGATGCGKTNLVLRLIEADIANKATLCVLDLRGDLVDRILLRLAALGEADDLAERLCLVELRQDRFVTGFNPLAGNGEVHSRALHVLGDIRRHADSWGVQLDETLRNALIALAEAKLSMLELEPLLCEPSVRSAIVARCRDPYVRSFFSRFDALSAESRSAWTTPVLNKVTPFLSLPRVRLMFGARTALDFRQLLGRPGRIVLISLAVDRLREAAHLVGALLVSAVESAVLARVDQPEAHRHPVNLYVDEFETMASPSFRSLVAEGRRFGISLTLSHQNLGQVDADLREVLRNNVHTQVFFQTGIVDATAISGDVVGCGTKESVREALVSQGIGEAFLVRRGQSTLRVKTALSEDPPSSSEAVEKLRAASLAKWGQPREVVEGEIETRLPAFRRDALAGTQLHTELEVRHERMPKHSSL